MEIKYIHNHGNLDSLSNEYIYLSSTTFVKKKQKVHLVENSPMICIIVNMLKWDNMNGGMLMMYTIKSLDKCATCNILIWKLC